MKTYIVKVEDMNGYPDPDLDAVHDALDDAFGGGVGIKVVEAAPSDEDAQPAS
jgi:hypothetical protein